MIAVLLLLIVFILLFGAAAVKGWLKGIASYVGGFAVVAGLALWLGSYFGEDGPIYVIMGGMGLLALLAFWVKATEPIHKSGSDPSPTYHSRRPSREQKKVLRERYRERRGRD